MHFLGAYRVGSAYHSGTSLLRHGGCVFFQILGMGVRAIQVRARHTVACCELGARWIRRPTPQSGDRNCRLGGMDIPSRRAIFRSRRVCIVVDVGVDSSRDPSRCVRYTLPARHCLNRNRARCPRRHPRPTGAPSSHLTARRDISRRAAPYCRKTDTSTQLSVVGKPLVLL